MTAAKRPQPITENKPSFLLTREENEQLFRLIGNRCKSIATAVVQVLYPSPPSYSQWNKRHCGVLCFIKDNVKRSYFFRIFCLTKQELLWEQELYNSFEYHAPRPYFHTFEGDESRVGLNFAEQAEAEFYLAAVKDYLKQKIDRREKRRSQAAQQPRLVNKPPVNSEPLAQAPTPAPTSSWIIPNFSSKKNKKDKKQKLTKADIGLPSDFKHVSHVGWDPNKGFALENVDPTLLQFFARAGVSETHLQDKATRDFIYDFIDKHGGMEAALREVSQVDLGSLIDPPPVPVRNPPTPQTGRTAPPPPSRVVASPASAPPPPPHRAAPPPAPTKYSAHPPPAPPSSPPPPPPISAVPPPPPPPMNLPPPPPNFAPPPPDARSALLEGIRGGTTLKAVEDNPRPAKPATDSRSDLLGQIRAGVALKSVENAPNKGSAPPSEDGMAGMAGALSRALMERSKAIHSDSESEDDDAEDEDDDWDD